MSREAVLLQWERKIEVAERLEEAPAELAQEPDDAEPDYTQQPRRRRFERAGAERADEHAGVERAGAQAGAERPEAHAGAERADAHRAAAHAHDAALAAVPLAERRTITITGQPTPARRRRPMVDAQLAQPDRVALWAFLLGLLLVAVAAGTAHV